jgi:hypothetical protein
LHATEIFGRWKLLFLLFDRHLCTLGRGPPFAAAVDGNATPVFESVSGDCVGEGDEGAPGV